MGTIDAIENFRKNLRLFINGLNNDVVGFVNGAQALAKKDLTGSALATANDLTKFDYAWFYEDFNFNISSCRGSIKAILALLDRLEKEGKELFVQKYGKIISRK